MNTGGEQRLRVLEELIQRLGKELASLKDKVGQVAEDSPRQQDRDAFGGDVFFRLQSVGVIPASVGPGLGLGTARVLQTIGSTRYLLQPFAMGDVTIACANDTGSPTINNEYLIAAVVQGVMTALVGDCTTPSPTRAPDPPTG